MLGSCCRHTLVGPGWCVVALLAIVYPTSADVARGASLQQREPIRVFVTTAVLDDPDNQEDIDDSANDIRNMIGGGDLFELVSSNDSAEVTIEVIEREGSLFGGRTITCRVHFLGVNVTISGSDPDLWRNAAGSVVQRINRWADENYYAIKGNRTPEAATPGRDIPGRVTLERQRRTHFKTLSCPGVGGRRFFRSAIRGPIVRCTVRGR